MTINPSAMHTLQDIPSLVGSKRFLSSSANTAVTGTRAARQALEQLHDRASFVQSDMSVSEPGQPSTILGFSLS